MLGAATHAYTVFTFLNQGCDITYPGVRDLVGEILVPGVYCATAFRLSGTLTLSGSGVWIFKSASDLITSGTANVVGGDPCNVWWRVVSSATLGANTSLIGSILAATSISLQAGARLNGRALAQTGSVTLDNNTFTGPICAAANTPIPTATNTPILATNTPIPATNTPILATNTPILAATNTPSILAATNTRAPAPRDTRVPAPRDTPEPATPGVPGTDIPGDIPGTGVPETGVPGTGVPGTGVPGTDIPGTPGTATPTTQGTATPDIVLLPPVSLPPTGSEPPGRDDLLLTAVLAAWVVGVVALGLSRRKR